MLLDCSIEKMQIKYKPIGIIHSPFTTLEGMPIQPVGASGVKGTVEVHKEFQSGLKDLDGFSHIILLYHFHKSKGYNLHVVPFLDSVLRGVFATRAPKRPNPLGLSVVKLRRLEGRILHIENVDVLDTTPLLDIKPFVSKFDAHSDARAGWLEQAWGNASDRKSDGRFK